MIWNKCAEYIVRAGGGAHRTIWGFMKGFWPSDWSGPWMTQAFYIFCWKTNKIKIHKFLQCVCFILRPVKRQEKKNGRALWITIRLPLFLVHSLHLTNPLHSTGSGEEQISIELRGLDGAGKKGKPCSWAEDSGLDRPTSADSLCPRSPVLAFT